MKEYLSNVLEILEEKGVLNESYDLEFKSAKGGLPRSLWESYSAFANSEGGTIILGVSEKDNYCYLDGLGEDVVRKWLDDFWNQINNKEKVSVNLLTAKDVRIEKVKDDINVLKTCSEVKMYTIKPMVVSNIFPFTYIKQNLENGKIFSLDTNSYTLKQLDLIIKYVRQKGYDFVTLEEILNEKINDKY